MDCDGFGGYGRSTDDNAGDSDEMRDVLGIEIADCYVCDTGVKKDLVFGEFNVSLRGVDNALCTLFQSSFELERESAMSEHNR